MKSRLRRAAQVLALVPLGLGGAQLLTTAGWTGARNEPHEKSSPLMWSQQVTPPHGSCAQLFIAAPEEPGRYPAAIFLSGFALSPTLYTSLIGAIVREGFVVLAPAFGSSGFRAMLPKGTLSLNDEAVKLQKFARGVVHGDVDSYLPEGVTLNVSNGLALSGHSRGGAVAMLAAPRVAIETGRKPSLTLIDPVDVAPSHGVEPPQSVLQQSPSSMICPSIIFASDCGEAKSSSEAPRGRNYVDFDRFVNHASYLVELQGVLHLDFCDESPGRSAFLRIARCLLERGNNRKEEAVKVRQWAGHCVAAFAKYNLLGDDSILEELEHPQPVRGSIRPPLPLTVSETLDRQNAAYEETTVSQEAINLSFGPAPGPRGAVGAADDRRSERKELSRAF